MKKNTIIKIAAAAVVIICIAIYLHKIHSLNHDDNYKRFKAIKMTYQFYLYIDAFERKNKKKAECISDLVPEYFPKIEKDPWGNDYFLDTKEYVVFSPGADGKKYTSDDLSPRSAFYFENR